MVFKTLETWLNNFIGKSLESTIKDFKLSGGNVLSTLFKDSDTIALQKFNQELKNGVAWRTAYNNTMVGTSEQAQKNAQQYAILNARLKTYNAQLNANKITQEEYNTRVDTTKAKMAMLGVETETASLKAKLASSAFEMFKAALTAIAFTLIIQGISLLVNKISDLANNVSKTKEKVSELTDEFKSALSTANTNADKTEELISKYQQLSKGVNDLGENVALTNEEYTEYNSLVNEIAEMFPELVRGYTDEGNAILNLKGNVEKLRDAYKEAQQEAYNLLIASGENGDGNDIIKQWQDTQDTNFWASFFDLGADDVGGGISVSDAIDQLKAIQDMSAEEYRQLKETMSGAYRSDIAQLTDIEKEIGRSDYLTKALGLTWNISDEDFTEAKKQAKILVQTYNSEIQSALSDVKSLANAYLMTNEDYDKLDSSSKNAASIIVNSLNENIASGFNDKTDVGEYVQTIVDAFENADSKNAINNLFNLDTSNMSVKDINAEVDKYIDIIAKAIGEDSDKLKIRLGFEDINDTLERAKRKFQTGITFGSVPSDVYNAQISSFLEKLTPADLDIAMQIPDLFADGLEKASEKIQEFMADPNNEIGISFDYSSYSEQVDDVVKNVDKVQSALDKLNSGKGIDNKDITELANAFPDYSSKILSAADNTEKLKSVLSEIKSNAPSGLINTLRNLKDLSADDQDAVNGLIAILSNLNSAASNYADTLADLETKEGLLSTAYKEMHDDGQISLSTYQKLIDSGIDYSEAIENVNGKITVNSEKLKELTKAKYVDEIATLELTKAEIGRNVASDPKYYMEQINAIEDDIKAKKEAMELLDAYDYTTTSNKGKTEKPQSVLDFEKELAEKEHEINMGRMKEDENYYSWLLSAVHTAYDGLADYQDDLWKYEEEVHKGRKQLADDFYDEQQKDFEDRISSLEDDIDKAMDGKLTSLVSQSDIDDLNELNQTMQELYQLGNVDLTKRPKVNAETMRKAGYEAEDGETATVYSSFDFLWQGDEEHGKYVAVHYTPILPDGTVLDEKTLNDYLDTLVGSDDILKADTKGIILKVDSDVDVSDADVKSLETDKPTENIQSIIKACEDWDIALHNIQAEWMVLDEAVNNASEMHIEDKFEYIRSAYQEILNEIDGRINEIVQGGVEGHEDDLKKLEEQRVEYSDKLAELPKTAAEEEQTYIKKLKDDYSDLYDERIKKIKEQQDAAEKAAQSEIDAVQEKIDALKDANDKEQEALDIEKARKELEKASQSTRQVYGSDGSISFKADEEKVKEAQENLDKLIQERQINILEEQKDLLEQAKDKESEAYDSIIDNLETEKENSEKRFDILLDALDEYLNPDQGESNSDVWKELAHTEGATYKNGVWTDKDGNVIDIDELVNTVETAKKDDKQTDTTTNINTDNKQSKTDSKSGKDEVIISGNLERLERVDIGDETSEVKGKKPEEKAGSVIEAFFSNLEKKLGLKDGSLNLENAMQILNNSPMNKLDPYESMKQRNGVGADREHMSNVNNNNAANITIGDIVINNPVRNSDDLAKELRANLHNAADKIIYSNLR